MHLLAQDGQLCAATRRGRGAFVHVRGRGSVDQQTEQFRPAVVAARVHQLLAPVDQREIEIGDHCGLTRSDRVAYKRAIRRHDRSEATARDRTYLAACIFDDLRLPVGVQPGRCVDDETPGLHRMLPDVDFHRLGKPLAEDRAGIHGRMNLLTVGHHRVARERVVVLKTGQLADAANLAVDRAQARPVTLPPNHALVVGRRYLAATLDQGAIGVEQQLRVVETAAVTLIDADGYHDARLSGGLPERIGPEDGTVTA